MEKPIKGYLTWLPIILLFAISCTRNYSHPATAEAGCISRVFDTPLQSPLTTAEIDSIQALFAYNNMSTSGLQFISYTPDIYGSTTLNAPYQSQVSANLFLNGLPIFSYNEVFIFISGVFDTAYLYTGQPVNNNVDARIPLDSLHKDFLGHVSESKIYGPIGPPFTPSPESYLDSCLGATLGYIDATSVPGDTLPFGNLIKVWSVTPLNKTYPCVLVEDDNGLAWGSPIFIP